MWFTIPEGQSPWTAQQGTPGRQTSPWSSCFVLKSLSTSREGKLTGNGLGFWNLNAWPQWHTSSNKITSRQFHHQLPGICMSLWGHSHSSHHYCLVIKNIWIVLDWIPMLIFVRVRMVFESGQVFYFSPYDVLSALAKFLASTKQGEKGSGMKSHLI